MEFDVNTAIDAAVATQTKEERERWEKFQEQERAKVKMVDARAELGRRMIEIALRELESEYSDFEFTRMAEGYSFLGDFEQAVQITKDPDKKAFYRKVIEATNTDCVHGESFLYDKYPDFTLYICPKCGHFRKVA